MFPQAISTQLAELEKLRNEPVHIWDAGATGGESGLYNIELPLKLDFKLEIVIRKYWLFQQIFILYKLQ